VRLTPSLSEIPDAPGSYQFLDADGRVLYVGKAKSLRARLASYLGDPASLPPKTARLLAAADRVEWVQVGTEVEAIMLEYSLIKRHRPRFNVRLVDDKSYPWLALTVGHRWPRAAVVRGRRREGVRYFGPYAHAKAIRETLDVLIRSFPVRTCSDAKLERHGRLGRPCLLAHIGRCSAPCVGAIDEAEYRQLVEGLVGFLDGDTTGVVGDLEREMRAAAERLDFERAALLRDRLAAVRRALEHQQVVLPEPAELDVVGVAGDSLEVAVCVLAVRRGRLVGRRSMVVDRVEELTDQELAGRLLEQLYAEAEPQRRPAASRGARGEDPAADLVSGAGDPARMAGSSAWLEGAEHPGVPATVLLPVLPEDPPAYRAFLASRRGGAVELAAPRRGARRRLVELACTNAAEDLARHRLRRASDHASRARALEALKQALGLKEAPLRIECYDASHLHGRDYVGSMVVLEDGLPKPSEYRHFRLRTVPGNDDYAAMEELLGRRLRALLEARAARGEGRSSAASRRAFAYPPQLLVVDGGRGQLAVAQRVVEELGLAGELALAALAKELELVFVPGRSEPVEIPRGSEALFLLQRIRDEAHRFAVSYHRRLRARRMTKSILDDVPGLGPKRRARLVAELGGLRRLRQASFDELLGLGWLPESVARALFERLRRGDGHAAAPEEGLPALAEVDVAR
jgi:excinuclease ABC subunit C